MRITGYLACAFLAATALAPVGALANTCMAGHLTCATTMPVDGYCECTAHGSTEGGTVVMKPAGRAPTNAHAGGCGDQPNAPGCTR